TMIVFGIALVRRFHFVLYIFGFFLLITAARMFFGKHPAGDLRETYVMRICRRILPITSDFHEEHFKVRLNGSWMFTPLALTMITADYLPLPRVISLGIIVLILGATIGLSMLKTKDGTTAEARK